MYEQFREKFKPNRRKTIQGIQSLTAPELLELYDNLRNLYENGRFSNRDKQSLLVTLKRVNLELQERLPGRKDLSRELQKHFDEIRLMHLQNGNGKTKNNRGKRSRGIPRRRT